MTKRFEHNFAQATECRFCPCCNQILFWFEWNWLRLRSKNVTDYTINDQYLLTRLNFSKDFDHFWETWEFGRVWKSKFGQFWANFLKWVQLKSIIYLTTPCSLAKISTFRDVQSNAPQVWSYYWRRQHEWGLFCGQICLFWETIAGQKCYLWLEGYELFRFWVFQGWIFFSRFSYLSKFLFLFFYNISNPWVNRYYINQIKSYLGRKFDNLPLLSKWDTRFRGFNIKVT